MLKTVNKFLNPFIVIPLIVILFSLPFIKDNKAPIPTNFLVTWFVPWKYDYALPVKNGIPDVVTQIYPWKMFTIESLKKGELPLWNPYSFSGTPHLANYQSAVFSPLNILFFIFKDIDAWSIMILLQPLLAGIFMYLFAKSNGFSPFASTVSAISFMFGGFMTTWLNYGTIGYALLFLPLTLYGIKQIMDKGKFAGGMITSVSICFSLFSGHPQTSFYLILSAVLYSVFLKTFENKSFLRLFLALFFITIGILLSSIQLIPSLELYNFSKRSAISSFSAIKDALIPFQYLITVITPDFFGSPVTRNNWFGNYAEWANFAGILPFILALVTVISKDKKHLPVICLGITGLLFSTLTPVSEFLYKLNLPFFSNSPGGRAIIIFTFSIAFLAGRGLDLIRTDIHKYKKILAFSLVIVLLLVLTPLWLRFIFTDPVLITNLAIAKRNIIFPLLVLGSFIISFVLLARIKINRDLKIKLVGASILLLTSIDMFRFVSKWAPFDSKEYLYPQNKVLSVLTEKSKDHGRIFGITGQEVSIPFHLYSPEGASPLNMERYAALLGASKNGEAKQSDRTIAVIDKNGQYTKRILDILGVKYFVYFRDDRYESWVFPYWNYNYESIYSELHYEIFEDQNPVPRAFVTADYEIAKNDKEIINDLLDENFKPSNQIVLEKNPGIENGIAQESAEIAVMKPNKVTIKVKTDKPSLLYLSDTFYPGWQAFVDGKKTEILRANFAFRAVVTPAGFHLVEFIYRPLSLMYGAIISFLTLVVLIMTMFVIRKK